MKNKLVSLSLAAFLLSSLSFAANDLATKQESLVVMMFESAQKDIEPSLGDALILELRSVIGNCNDNDVELLTVGLTCNLQNPGARSKCNVHTQRLEHELSDVCKSHQIAFLGQFPKKYLKKKQDL